MTLILYVTSDIRKHSDSNSIQFNALIIHQVQTKEIINAIVLGYLILISINF